MQWQYVMNFHGKVDQSHWTENFSIVTCFSKRAGTVPTIFQFLGCHWCSDLFRGQSANSIVENAQADANKWC